MTLARFPLVLALACAALAAASGYGARVDLWDFRFGFRLLGWVPYAGLAAGALALLFALIPRIRAGNLPVLVLAFVVGCGVAYLPWQWRTLARSVPAINDVTTDPDNPPAFVAIIPLRAGASVPATYPGAAVAAAQRQAYPDIRPVELAVPPAAAFTRALDAARAAGWEIAAADPSAGRIEATATTPWFGFRDDVVVRITATAAGSRVDVRSVSRLGKSDLGTNAKRIRAYLARLAG